MGLPFPRAGIRLRAGSLDQQLDGTPWPAMRAARLAEQVALGIAEAHRQGIVHRDLKPSNVLAGGRRHAQGRRLWPGQDAGQQDGADAERVGHGLAQLHGTRAGPGAGSKEAGPAVDIYAMGAILYELLTGRPPFRGTTVLETLEQVKAAEPVPPSRLVPGLPRDIETICLKCLQKEPGKRYAKLPRRWRRPAAVSGRPADPARRSTSAERFWRWCRRNPRLAAANIAAAAATIILVIGSTIAAKVYYNKSAQIAEQAEKLKRSDIDSREKLFESQVERARAGRFSHRVGQRFESLDALAKAAKIGWGLDYPAEKLDPLRDEAIACMALPDLKPAGPPIRTPEGTIAFAFDAGMTRYAIRFRDGTILVRRMGDDQEIARFTALGDRDIWVFALSPDGKYLATNDYPSGAVVVWDVDRGALACAIRARSVARRPDSVPTVGGSLLPMSTGRSRSMT